MRKAFGIIQAIMIVLIVGGIALLTLKFATIQSKHYADSYLKEQAELFLLSAVEATLMTISGYERNETSGCVREVNVVSPDGKFEVNVTIEKYFLYQGKDSEGKNWPSSCKDLNVSIENKDSHGMILIHAVVENNATELPNYNIRIVRRSIQWP
jgi:hypothetical protein